MSDLISKTLQCAPNNALFVHDTNNTHIIDYHMDIYVCMRRFLATFAHSHSVSFYFSFRQHFGLQQRIHNSSLFSVFFRCPGCCWCCCMRIRMCVMYMLKDRCTSFRDSVIHNKWRHFQPNHSVLFHLYFLHFFVLATNHLLLVDCSFFGYLIASLFFLLLYVAKSI